jgi:hypothetical protein
MGGRNRQGCPDPQPDPHCIRHRQRAADQVHREWLARCGAPHDGAATARSSRGVGGVGGAGGAGGAGGRDASSGAQPRSDGRPGTAPAAGGVKRGPAPVPDFGSLHAAWGRRLAAAKAARRQRATVPQARGQGEPAPPLLAGCVGSAVHATVQVSAQVDGLARPSSIPAPSPPNPIQAFDVYHDSPEQLAAREARAAARAASIAAAASSTEPRGPPVLPRPATDAARRGAPPLAVGGTLAARLKAEATRRAREEGRFDSQEERWASLFGCLGGDVIGVQRTGSRCCRPGAVSASAPPPAASPPRERRRAEAAAAAARARRAARQEGAPTHRSGAALGAHAGGGESDASAGAAPASGGGSGATAVWRERAAAAAGAAAAAAAARPASRAASPLGTGRAPSPGSPGRAPRGPAAAKRAALAAARREAPVMHTETRHAQAAAAARALVRDALLAQGLDALRFVEE